MTTFVDLDLRPILRAGGEPFEKIMETVAALGPDQGLRVFATFKPTPLLQVLGSKGFAHEAKELGGGEWEVLFRPSKVTADGDASAALPTNDSVWSNPTRHLDNRDLDPPEPMVRILAATETMKEGEVLSALLCREPTFLLAELAKRGHRWRGAFEPDGTTYKIIIRVGLRRGAAA
jgi:uncharacterized protein (DUF2249 family)